MFQGITKFETLQRLRESEENKNLLMTLFRESKPKIDYFKELLKNNKIKWDQLKKELIVVEENNTDLKIMLYYKLLVLTF